MPPSRQPYETIIVGAGPIGLELAVLLKQAGVDYLHLDKGTIGQTITWFPRQMRFFSSNDRIAIAGLPLQTSDQSKASREEYLAYLRHVAMAFDLEVNTWQEVTDIRKEDGLFQVTARHAGAESRHRARTVVVATGGMHGPKLLNIPGEDLPHVDHFFEEPHRYFGTRLVIVGGRNSAVEAALRCHHAGARVTISYRQRAFDAGSVKYWLLPELTGRIQRGEITAHFQTEPRAITSNRILLEKSSGEQIQVEADFVLLLTGYLADMSLLAGAGVSLTGPDEAPLFDEQTMQTDVPGLYVAGTVTAGTQGRFKIFLENCHVHAERILSALTGQMPPGAPNPHQKPES